MSFNYLIFRPSHNKLSNVLITDNEIICFAKLVEVVAIHSVLRQDATQKKKMPRKTLQIQKI